MKADLCLPFRVFLQHIHAPEEGLSILGLRQQQDLLDPLQQKLADGCHLTRETGRLIKESTGGPPSRSESQSQSSTLHKRLAGVRGARQLVGVPRLHINFSGLKSANLVPLRRQKSNENIALSKKRVLMSSTHETKPNVGEFFYFLNSESLRSADDNFSGVGVGLKFLAPFSPSVTIPRVEACLRIVIL